MQLASGYAPAACLYTAARLKIADLLAGGPKPASELAHARDVHEDGRLALGSFRQRAREIAGDEGVEPLGRVGEKQLVAGLQSREGGF